MVLGNDFIIQYRSIGQLHVYALQYSFVALMKLCQDSPLQRICKVKQGYSDRI